MAVTPIEIRTSSMQMPIAWLLALALMFALSGTCLAEPSAAELCVMDLQAIPGFLLENDAGAKAHLAQYGQRHFDDAFDVAIKEARQVADASSCKEVLNRYLRAWRKAHLAVRDSPTQLVSRASGYAGPPVSGASASRDKDPTLRVLSSKTVLLTVKSFDDSHRDPLVILLKRNHETLANHPNWIIDVRGNGGGSDSTYKPLLPWLLADEVSSTSAEWLVTPANIEGQRLVCPRVSPGDAECERYAAEALARMSTVGTGNYVAQDNLPPTRFERQPKLETRRPSRVAVLMDGGCGSSCEEFLLVARQSFTVKLIGRRSYGSLDYSNVRPYPLPSGQRDLWYATSRSFRLPDDPVDLSGVSPDIYLPLAAVNRAAEVDVLRVQKWLEGGSLEVRKLVNATNEPSGK